MTGLSTQPFEKLGCASALLADQSGRCPLTLDSGPRSSTGAVQHSPADAYFALRSLLAGIFVRGIARTVVDHIRPSKSVVSHQPNEDLFAKLSHELRTPLNAVLGFSELILLHDKVTRQECRAAVENIHSSGQRLMAIIEAIFHEPTASADIASFDKTSLNVRQHLSEALGMLRPKIQRSQCACYLVADDDLFIDADPDAFRRMVVGLLSYPLRCSGPDSVVIVSAGRSGADTFVEIRWKDLLAARRRRCDALQIDRVRALALAHGGRLHRVDDSDEQGVARLTFFATCAVL